MKGGEGLAGVPGRPLRLAAAALGAGREVEDALPGEALDLRDAGAHLFRAVLVQRGLEVDLWPPLVIGFSPPGAVALSAFA